MTEDKDQNEESSVITEEEDRLNKWRLFGGGMTLLWLLTLLVLGVCNPLKDDYPLLTDAEEHTQNSVLHAYVTSEYASHSGSPVESHPCYKEVRDLVPETAMHPDFTRVIDIAPNNDLHPTLPTRYTVGPIWIYDADCHVLGPGPSGLVFLSIDAWWNFESGWERAAPGWREWMVRQFPASVQAE